MRDMQHMKIQHYKLNMKDEKQNRIVIDARSDAET